MAKLLLSSGADVDYVNKVRSPKSMFNVFLILLLLHSVVLSCC